ncbi:endoplasmic reticulum junction formation protein lunapark-B [Scomber scombrus]|uniref:Endoplasmic reticulum junction formation protein lunapark-B n=1 Tax=Scomber scombrus TaxID=13677 RepID=A0AAV1NMN6_SCOSC
MGALISRWKAKPTTVEKLENLDKEIQELDEFRAKNQRLQKLWVGRLLFYSSVLYLLISLIVYCLYLPEQWLERFAMALPFFIYPVLVWFIRRFLIFLFSKRTERNNDKLEDLKVSKKKILEEVMETETYKNAKLILERFDPDAKKKAELESTPMRPQMTPRPGQEIRQRGVAMRPMPMGTPGPMPMGTPGPMPMGTPGPMPMTPQRGAQPPLGPGGTPVAPGGPPERSALSASVLHGAVPRTPCSPIPGVGMHPPGPPLARPILPKDRGAVDRVIEYLPGRRALKLPGFQSLVMREGCVQNHLPQDQHHVLGQTQRRARPLLEVQKNKQTQAASRNKQYQVSSGLGTKKGKKCVYVKVGGNADGELFPIYN